ncbi:MAG TPA: hypothetical protein VJX10_07645 [Pseudonocardiaceae bacterium]|nr:hypothetical protein [Pseudonocardiaceae bacterium]
MSEPYDYRAPAPPHPGRPQGWTGTSQMPSFALGAPQPQTRDYAPYGPPDRDLGRGGSGGRFRPDRTKLVDYTLKGLGLVGVALVSGFLWYLIRNNPAQQPVAHSSPPSAPAGVYAFQPYSDPSTVTDCAAHATRDVQRYLQGNLCVSLRRSLFTASLADNDKVITSVAVVRMPTAAMASQLRRISDGNATGHVRDLVEDGVVVPGGPTSLQDAGYYSTQHGARVVIVMTEFVDADKDSAANLNANDHTLRAVSADAAKQGIGGSGD